MSDEPHPTFRCALVVAQASIWRDALVSLLRAQSNLEVCHIVGDLSAARALIEHGTVMIVFVECTADDSALLAFITWLRNTHPAVRCIVAVDTHAQDVHCIAAGAHMTLMKGWLDEGLLQQSVAD